MKGIQLFVFLVMLTFSRLAVAGFEADVSRTVIPEGESFQLYLRQDGDAEQPDISVLNQDFLIVMERKSFKSSYVNGKAQTFNENVLTLIPKKTGEVILPSIQAGKEKTKPVKLTVVAGGQPLPEDPVEKKQAQSAQPNVFIRYELADKQPYIGQQIPLTVKLYSFVQTPLLDGAVIPPQADGITSEQWGDVKRSRETVNGRSYDVLEYKFLLFAQKSGKITLSPVRFRGTISDPNARSDNMNDLFGFGGLDDSGFFSGFFGQQNVAVQTSAITLDVRGKPEKSGVNWLPATEVAISEDLNPPKQTINLGEALTRTVTVMAAGVRDTQIPDLLFSQGENYKQYPGKTDTKNLFDNNGIVGVKTRQIVFMPTKAGEITLPKMEIPWFDVKTGETRVAVLPQRTITVQTVSQGSGEEKTDLVNSSLNQPSDQITPDNKAAPVSKQTKPVVTQQIEQTHNREKPETVSKVKEKYAGQSPVRLFFFFFLAGGAVVTVLGLLLHFLLFKSNSKTGSKVVNTKTSRQEAMERVKQACLSESGTETKQALLDLGRILWPETPPLTLSDLSKRFNNQTLSEQMEKLNQALYAQNGASWNAKEFWTVFKTVQVEIDEKEKKEKMPVPPLYPN